jgi:hypothetical protein
MLKTKSRQEIRREEKMQVLLLMLKNLLEGSSTKAGVLEARLMGLLYFLWSQ